MMLNERTLEQDKRLAAHEAGHCFMRRVFDRAIGGATIVAGDGFSGLVWSDDGDCSKLGSDGEEVLAEFNSIAPRIGESRNDAALLIIRASQRAVELLAGDAAEAVLHGGKPLLNANNDWKQAQAYAAIVCVSSTTISDFLDFAFAEATALIEKFRPVVQALADALLERQTLDGKEIDQVIAAALVAQDSAAERLRREQMKLMHDNAQKFLQEYRTQ
jgi:hypothetical protein